MSGRRMPLRPRLYRITSQGPAAAFSIAANYSGYVDIFLWGGGASGVGNATPAGGSGAAVYRRVAIKKGQVISGTIGAKGAGSLGARNAGADSTITYPDGLTATAGGAPNDGSGGIAIASGDTVKRDGSAATMAGTDGGGSAGSTGGGGEQGGAGPPGFVSYVTGLTYGIGGTSGGSAATMSGGGNGNSGGASGAGGDGVLLAYWYRLD